LVVLRDDEALWLSDSGPTDSGPIPDYGTGEERRRRASAPSASSLTESPGPRPGPARDHQTETGRILESLRRRRGVAPSAGDPAPVGTQPTGAAAPSPATGAGGLRLVGDANDTTIDGAHTAPSRPEDAQDASIVALPSSAGGESRAPASHDHHTEPIGTPRFDAPAPASPDAAGPQPTAPEAEAPAAPTDADGPGSDHPSLLDDPALADWSDGQEDASPEAPAENASSPAAPDEEAQTQRRRGRASVPSWDEIMFGGRGRD
ncbi:MAG TPA: hypothetical protein H9793_11295, partial [Candidatus Brevibacterium intestinigallinarum]|nr:hypothetical protein [Candidatus Brevibacterium intestinigallinarum]